MEYQAIATIFVIGKHVRHSKGRSSLILIFFIQESPHAEYGRKGSVARSVKTVHVFCVRCRETNLQTAGRPRLLDIFHDGEGQNERHHRILCPHGNFISRVGRIVRFPFLKFRVPCRIGNLRNAVVEILGFSAFHLPTDVHLERFLIRQGIAGELVRGIEWVKHVKGNEGDCRISIVKLGKEGRIAESDIEHQVARNSGLRPQEGAIRSGKHLAPFIRLCRHGQKSVYRKRLDPVAIRHALVFKPAAEGVVVGIKQARRQR